MGPLFYACGRIEEHGRVSCPGPSGQEASRERAREEGAGGLGWGDMVLRSSPHDPGLWTRPLRVCYPPVMPPDYELVMDEFADEATAL